MTSPTGRTRQISLYVVGAILGLISAFFIFYTIRLLYVTRLLSALHKGGQGAYIGAAAFPILALVFGFISWRCAKAARRKKQ